MTTQRRGLMLSYILKLRSLVVSYFLIKRVGSADKIRKHSDFKAEGSVKAKGSYKSL